MSVIVTGVKMPKCCGECEASGTGVCRKWRMEYAKTFPPDCPLISVDSLIEQMEAAKFADPDGIDRDKRYNDGIRACIAILRGLGEK